jgi:hypothetical protein
MGSCLEILTFDESKGGALMARRAEPSGKRLTEVDASVVLGMVERGDRHHDIAAWFGVNQGRIAEVISRDKFPDADPAAEDDLPPPGPYSSGQAAHKAVLALEESKKALDTASKNIEAVLKEIRKK